MNNDTSISILVNETTSENKVVKTKYYTHSVQQATQNHLIAWVEKTINLLG